MNAVTVRFFAAARDAAGASEEQQRADRLAELIAELGNGRPELARVLTMSSFLVDGRQVDDGAPLADGAVIDVLPPFAGG